MSTRKKTTHTGKERQQGSIPNAPPVPAPNAEKVTRTLGQPDASSLDEKTAKIDSETLRAWLILLRAPGLGPVRVQTLLRVFDNPIAVLRASRKQRQTTAKVSAKTDYALTHPDWQGIEKDLTWLEGPQRYFLPYNHPYYPQQLRQIGDPPIALFVEGQRQLLLQPQLAMVGSRNPDHYGKTLAGEFATDLAKNGITITSGMALGIDAYAHLGALAVNGDTVAVVATGLDKVYPAAHIGLAEQIRRHGCMVSEFPIGTVAKAPFFPRRNRIISALSLGTFVVQAALRSGSLITARLANEQGRDVFALPGSIHNPLSKGCHSLIREGAKLVETSADILFELSTPLNDYLKTQERFTNHTINGIMVPVIEELRSEPNLDVAALTPTQQAVLVVLSQEPCSIDILVEHTHLNTEVVSSVLQEMEIRGHVSSHAGRYYRIQP